MAVATLSIRPVPPPLVSPDTVWPIRRAPAGSATPADMTGLEKFIDDLLAPMLRIKSEDEAFALVEERFQRFYAAMRSIQWAVAADPAYLEALRGRYESVVEEIESQIIKNGRIVLGSENLINEVLLGFQGQTSVVRASLSYAVESPSQKWEGIGSNLAAYLMVVHWVMRAIKEPQRFKDNFQSIRIAAHLSYTIGVALYQEAKEIRLFSVDLDLPFAPVVDEDDRELILAGEQDRASLLAEAEKGHGAS